MKYIYNLYVHKVSPLERTLPQNAEFLLFEGIHKYDLLYLKSCIQYTSLALWACKVYWKIDSEFTWGCTYCKPSENWEPSIDPSSQAQSASKLQSIWDSKLKQGTFVRLQRARILHSAEICILADVNNEWCKGWSNQKMCLF